MTPAAPAPQKPVGSLPAAPRPKVVEVKVPEQKTRQIPKKISRRRKDKLFAPKAGASSSRQKTSIILFVVISTALVIVLARPYLASHKKPVPPIPPDPRTIMATFKIDWPIPPVYSKDIRDPMVELSSEKPPIIAGTPGGLMVMGIVVGEDEDRIEAIIGTDHLHEGDIVPGTKIRVKKINLNSVEFEEDGKISILKTGEILEIEGEAK
jgi:hypothetical protein